MKYVSAKTFVDQRAVSASGTGSALTSCFVYGCAGRLRISFVSPTSTSSPLRRISFTSYSRVEFENRHTFIMVHAGSEAAEGAAAVAYLEGRESWKLLQRLMR